MIHPPNLRYIFIDSELTSQLVNVMRLAAVASSMSERDTKERIVTTLRNTDEPALSAQKLADELGLSVRTINNHVDTLLKDDRIAATQIGNATAYFIPFGDLPSHKKPDHTCQRCGRDVDENYDFAKIDTDTYFSGDTSEPGLVDFYVLCRFCYSDLVSWLYNDLGSIGDYPFVHNWDLPTEQLEEVREDPDTQTVYDGDNPRLHLSDEETAVYDFIHEHAGTGDEDEADPVRRETLIESIMKDYNLYRHEVESAIQDLKQRGQLFEPQYDQYLPAK
ncbi:helix-turn-helix domain-containing protein (plasmid) [Natrinema zhouii]|uniref:helix-turn-helix domain-containing protein n=1 Tax=Natrinema zhouii TaxID=1710539 RepID=UPI001D001380|nr:helix-turn-helix domain-containing protein [Natrinema zhouii]UHQ98940.1 helix-turn-helix domain-containing protein [Natrinema zhouii]